MLCVLLLPVAAFLLRAEAAIGVINNNNNNNHDNNNNNNNPNTADTDKWISDKDKYWSKFRDNLPDYKRHREKCERGRGKKEREQSSSEERSVTFGSMVLMFNRFSSEKAC
ncbi:hypothetical protein C0J45_9666 [Silurus meridionalis]|nr:hypothetical protein C0J45_9666 [Silurus meridionalis]